MGNLIFYSLVTLGLAVVTALAILVWKRRAESDKADQSPTSVEVTTPQPTRETNRNLAASEEQASLRTSTLGVKETAATSQPAQALVSPIPDHVPSPIAGATEPPGLQESRVEHAESSGPPDVHATQAHTAVEVQLDNANELQGQMTAQSELVETREPDLSELTAAPTTPQSVHAQLTDSDADQISGQVVTVPDQPASAPVYEAEVQAKLPDSHPTGELEPRAVPVMDGLRTTVILESSPASQAEVRSAPPIEEGQGSDSALDNPMEVEEERRPAQYRPPRVAPPKPRASEPRKALSADRDQPHELRLQAHVDRHGFWTFRLLAQRPEGMPSELQVCWGNKTVGLIESGDDWYEVEQERELAGWLSGGVVFVEKRRGESRLSWQLSRRDIHVLAGQQGLAGLVSTTRLCIARKHLILCRAERASEVSVVLSESGCGSLPARAEDFGAPPGWVLFWPVIPQRPLAPAPGDDILNLLRPQPEVELLLEGGLWLRDSTWLVGYPPQIRLSGVLPTEEAVYIDGQPAQRSTDGSFSIASYDQPGEHSIWCVGKARTYSISKPEGGWEIWEPHAFRRGMICGASALPRLDTTLSPVTVPATNPVLIGAEPGQVFFCPTQSRREWTGLVPFQAVWSVPLDPLHCDRSSCQVLLVKHVAPMRAPTPTVHRSKLTSAIGRWCQAIRDCRRKGLAVSPADAQTEALWAAYAAQAKALWRQLT